MTKKESKKGETKSIARPENSKEAESNKDINQASNQVSKEDLKNADPLSHSSIPPKLSPEQQKKLDEIKKKVENFSNKVKEKFDKYIMGVALLPPAKEDSEKKNINVLVLVNDLDSKKMSKLELKDKLSKINEEIAKEIDPNIIVKTVILSELWQNCYDGLYDLIEDIAMSAPIYDTGTLGAIKIAEIHRSMVMKKFDKYIVSYVLWGSIARGTATKDSDIDVCIIIDDTDVKRMSRGELKDKLRAIILNMGFEAGDITGIKNKINIQSWLLTDFWEGLRDAVPTYFTALRDGVPLHDRGTFMPWRQLLKMGKIKPSQEAIDMFMSSGEDMIKRIKDKLMTLVEADIYWATLTPTQAVIMLYGLPPPTPKETIEMIDEIFVKKEKLLEKEYVEIFKKIRDYYKRFEHGEIKEITGKEVDDLLYDADKYMKRIKRLTTQIEKIKEKERFLHDYETVISVCRDVLRVTGVEEIGEDEIPKRFVSEIVNKGKISDKYGRIISEIVKAKKDYDNDRLSKIEIEKVNKEFNEFIKECVDFVQRERTKDIEKMKIRVKYGNKYGEIVITGETMFIFQDLDSKEKTIEKAKLSSDGSIGTKEKSSYEEYEQHISVAKAPKNYFVKEKLFEELKKIFGPDIEISVGY